MKSSGSGPQVAFLKAEPPTVFDGAVIAGALAIWWLLS